MPASGSDDNVHGEARQCKTPEKTPENVLRKGVTLRQTQARQENPVSLHAQLPYAQNDSVHRRTRSTSRVQHAASEVTSSQAPSSTRVIRRRHQTTPIGSDYDSDAGEQYRVPLRRRRGNSVNNSSTAHYSTRSVFGITVGPNDPALALARIANARATRQLEQLQSRMTQPAAIVLQHLEGDDPRNREEEQPVAAVRRACNTVLEGHPLLQVAIRQGRRVTAAFRTFINTVNPGYVSDPPKQVDVTDVDKSTVHRDGGNPTLECPICLQLMIDPAFGNACRHLACSTCYLEHCLNRNVVTKQRQLSCVICKRTQHTLIHQLELSDGRPLGYFNCITLPP